jgi:uncharacterized membrane protein
MDRFELLALARVLHVLGVVLWIGGVAFVTLALLPAVRGFEEPARRIALFEAVERRFARQARWTTLLTGATGFAMLWGLDAWGRYLDARFWWLHAMTGVWLLFTAMLFVLEPLFLHAWFQRRAAAEPERTFATVLRLHRVLLAASLLTVVGAVAGSHGWLLGSS